MTPVPPDHPGSLFAPGLILEGRSCRAQPGTGPPCGGDIRTSARGLAGLRQEAVRLGLTEALGLVGAARRARELEQPVHRDGTGVEDRDVTVA